MLELGCCPVRRGAGEAVISTDSITLAAAVTAMLELKGILVPHALATWFNPFVGVRKAETILHEDGFDGS